MSAFVGKVKLHAGQVTAFLAKVAILIVIAGIRGGKTHVGALRMIFYALEHPTLEDEYHLVCSPTYPMSKVPVEKMFALLYDTTIFPINPLVRYIKSKRTFVLRAANGKTTKIMVMSLHDPNRVRGIKALSAWIDEAAYISREAWQIVQGRVADSAGPIWITTTPAGYNWVYDLYEQSVREWRAGLPQTIQVVHFTSLQNSFILDRSGFDRLTNAYDQRTYDQEVSAKFVKVRGLVYHAFSRKRNIIESPLNPRLPLIVGQDFNVDPMASALFQPYLNSAGETGIRMIGERIAPNTDTFGLIEFLDRYSTDNRIAKGRVVIHPDASGKARSTSGKSDFALLEDAGYRVVAPPANPPIRDRVNCVNGLLRPRATKIPRLVVDPSCEAAIDAFEKQIWEPESDPPVPDKTHGFDHIADAIGYAAWGRHPLQQRMTTGTKPKPYRKAA